MFFKIYNSVLGLSERYQGQKLSTTGLTRIIRGCISNSDYIFRTARDPIVAPDMVVVSGLYDCWNESQGLPYIEIDVCYHPDQEYFFVDLIDWPRLAFDLAECVCHEWIHQQQHHSGRRYRRYSSHHLDPEIRSEQEYLGSEDEIDAYGFSIAADSVVNETHWHSCEMYQVYQRVFKHDPNIIVKLQKEIVKYLKRLEQDHARQISRNTRS